MRWATIALMVANAGLAIANGQLISRNRNLLDTNHEIAATYKRLAEQLPPHPCGTTIIPGERCTMTLRLVTPTAPPKTY